MSRPGHIHVESRELARPFAPIPAQVLFDVDLSPSARLLYGVLVWLGWREHHTGHGGYDGQEAVGEMLGVTGRSVRSWMTELREAGYLSTESDLGAPDTIILHELPRKDNPVSGPDRKKSSG